MRFGLDGRDYKIDLTDKEQTELRDTLAQYIAAAKPAGRATAVKKSASSSQDTAAIREWAKEHGFDVPERGRFPKEVKEAYAAK